MADQTCKHCGKKFISGVNCAYSPVKKHVLLTDGKHCVYCGKTFSAGQTCAYAPDKRHKLDA